MFNPAMNLENKIRQVKWKISEESAALKLTREAVELLQLAIDNNYPESSFEDFLGIVAGTARMEWGEHTVTRIIGSDVVIEHFDGREEKIPLRL